LVPASQILFRPFFLNLKRKIKHHPTPFNKHSALCVYIPTPHHTSAADFALTLGWVFSSPLPRTGFHINQSGSPSGDVRIKMNFMCSQGCAIPNGRMFCIQKGTYFTRFLFDIKWSELLLSHSRCSRGAGPIRAIIQVACILYRLALSLSLSLSLSLTHTHTHSVVETLQSIQKTKDKNRKSQDLLHLLPSYTFFIFILVAFHAFTPLAYLLAPCHHAPGMLPAELGRRVGPRPEWTRTVSEQTLLLLGEANSTFVNRLLPGRRPTPSS
jgi:hypothetical protein